MTGKTFDQTSVDVQATPAEPVRPKAFDFEAYADYEVSLQERCRDFWQAESGVLVHRRMRIADTGIVVNARIVGDPETVAETVKRLWKPGMKLIVVTFCQTPEEQAEAYDRVHEICG